jgi:hypothetical protein
VDELLGYSLPWHLSNLQIALLRFNGKGFIMYKMKRENKRSTENKMETPYFESYQTYIITYIMICKVNTV